MNKLLIVGHVLGFFLGLTEFDLAGLAVHKILPLEIVNWLATAAFAAGSLTSP